MGGGGLTVGAEVRARGLHRIQLPIRRLQPLPFSVSTPLLVHDERFGRGEAEEDELVVFAFGGAQRQQEARVREQRGVRRDAEEARRAQGGVSGRGIWRHRSCQRAARRKAAVKTLKRNCCQAVTGVDGAEMPVCAPRGGPQGRRCTSRR